MQITFDTTTITDDEVRGIFALLDTVRPAALSVGEPEWTGVQITKRTDTGEEVSREPIPTTEDDDYERKSLAMFEKIASYSSTDANGPIPIAEDPDDPKHLGVHPIVSIDANGLPWDERIHSGTKALNADGTWRTKRGVDKALVAEVEAELRSQGIAEIDAANEKVAEMMGVPDAQTVAATPAPPAPPAPGVAIVQHTSAPEPVVNETHVTIPATTSPFVALMKRVTTAQGAGKLTAQRVKELLESLDKKSIMDLRTDTDALDAFAVLLDGEGV